MCPELIPVKKRPLEFFGQDTDYPPSLTPKSWKPESNDKGLICPFAGIQCVKRTKTPPVNLIGSCIVGLPIPSRRGKYEPVIICPKRFYQNDIIFKDIFKAIFHKQVYSSQISRILISPELGTPKPLDRMIDWVMAVYDKNGNLLDYAAIEIQATATGSTGPIVPARDDFFLAVLKDKYNFGSNIMMSSKTILEQIVHKVNLFSSWKRKAVLIIQNNFLKHLQINYNLSKFGPILPEHSLIILSYKLEKAPNGNGYCISLEEAIGIRNTEVPKIILPNESMLDAARQKESDFISKIAGARSKEIAI